MTTQPSGSAGPEVPEPSGALVVQWTACALVAAVTRFLPVPVLDDAVAERARRVAVARTLRSQARAYPVTAVEPLYADRRGRGPGRHLRRLGRTVLLFPVRKYSRVVTAVHGVPNDVARVLLLARATHRRLVLGGLAGPGTEELAREATAVRAAFEAVVDEMDLRLLRGAVGDAVGGVRELTRSVTGLARRRFARDREAEVAVTEVAEAAEVAAQGPDDAVAEGADAVREALDRPEVVRLLEEFDRRMDQRLARAQPA